MTLATLAEVLDSASHQNRAVAGLVVSGWEDARAYVDAAQACDIPIILQAGPGCRKHTPVPILGKMFRHLAESASVPVVCHIDHGYSVEECVEGIDAGFTSVMFDGSNLPINQNIDLTAAIVEKAHAADVSVEGEVGFVGYDQGEQSRHTSPQDAKQFGDQSGADALAISVGNVHLQTEKTAGINFEAIRAIEAVTDLPLVLHGGSGIPSETRARLSKTTRVCKFNIGTELRMAFGTALRQSIDQDPHQFDRIKLLQATIDPVRDATMEVIRNLWQ